VIVYFVDIGGSCWSSWSLF